MNWNLKCMGIKLENRILNLRESINIYATYSRRNITILLCYCGVGNIVLLLPMTETHSETVKARIMWDPTNDHSLPWPGPDGLKHSNLIWDKDHSKSNAYFAVIETTFLEFNPIFVCYIFKGSCNTLRSEFHNYMYHHPFLRIPYSKWLLFHVIGCWGTCANCNMAVWW